MASTTALSVQPAWMTGLPLQQQSVLFLGARGPDGIGKAHDAKAVVRAYRATVLLAARYGRSLDYGERGDSFMCLHNFGLDGAWGGDVDAFFRVEDELPHHYLMHLYHGAQILGFKHPDVRFRARWHWFYTRAIEGMHLMPETAVEMDMRLGDWDRTEW